MAPRIVQNEATYIQMFSLAVMGARNIKGEDRQEYITLKKEIKSYFADDLRYYSRST